MKNEPTLKYCDYTLYDVFNCTTPELRDKVIDLWERNKALPEGVNPEERAYQVAIAVYDSNSEVIGVTTAYEDLFPLIPHSFKNPITIFAFLSSLPAAFQNCLR